MRANLLIIRRFIQALDKCLTQQSRARCNFAPVMKRYLALSLSCLLLMGILLTGCEKKEQAIVLPAPGPATPGSIAMGENYEQQVFYDLEANKVVSTSAIASWDLAFEAAADGRHVYMNGGSGVFLYNTHQLDFASVKALPAGVSTDNLQFDDPSGRPDSTAVRDWWDSNGQSKREVFIAKLNDTAYYKFVLLAVTPDKYEFQYGRLADATPIAVSLPKDAAYNFSYFSFKKGAVTPEPPRASWDIVFTRYRYIYRDLNNYPYEVNGVLLNPYKVMAAADSLRGFDVLTFENTQQLLPTTNRDVIGSDWKIYNFSTGRYEVNKKKCYIIHTRNEQVYKLHFLDFYSTTGVKGSPSFESQQIQ